MSHSMASLSNSPLLAGRAHLDRIAVIGSTQTWTWRQIHLASLALAGQLGKPGAILNLCNSRAGFFVTWLAALRISCLQLLPPSGGQADLAALLDSCPDPLVIADDEQVAHAPWIGQARCLLNSPVATQWSLSEAVLSWQPDWQLPAVRLYTSGSTGTPEPQMRTLGQLARGAQHLARRLDEEVEGGFATVSSIVCSVPPQHMFGLETSVMLSLVYGIPVLDNRPLLPADVQAAFKQIDAGAAWIATPLHLRAFVKTGEALSNCRVLISSTMPLDPAVASLAEVLLKAPVLEIYGSTETGVLAMRRTAKDIRWRPVHDVQMHAGPTGTQVSGSHFPSPQTLSDDIEVDDDGHFRLLGRHGDMLKIAGKRTSLAGLNGLLQDLPGLTDGVFYLPTTSAPADRLILIYVGAPLASKAAERWLRERIDPVFIPRGIIRVSSLERTDSGKLSRAVLDRIYLNWRAERRTDEPI